MSRAFDITWTDSSLIETENKIVRALPDGAPGVCACWSVEARQWLSVICDHCFFESPPSVTANNAVHAAKPGSEIASADGSMCQQTAPSNGGHSAVEGVRSAYQEVRETTRDVS